MIILSLITLIAIIHAYRSYPKLSPNYYMQMDEEVRRIFFDSFSLDRFKYEPPVINHKTSLYVIGEQSIESHGSPFERA